MEDMGSSAAGSQYFPPGFRFHPTDQELIIHYLRNKVISSNSTVTAIIADVDIYKFNPWDLPDKAFFGEGEWFFFSPRDRKYPNGARPNRGAASGYWKATGTDKPILASGGSKCLGVKKGLVFYKGRPKGVKTDWLMHEYRLLDHAAATSSSLPPLLLKHNKDSSMRLDDWVLCRVRQKGIAAQSDEKVEANIIIPCSPTNRNIEQLQLQQQATTTRVKTSNYNNNSSSSSCFCDWSDEQLLDILLLGSQQDDQKVAVASGGGDSCHSGLSSPLPPANGTPPPLLLPPEQQHVSSIFDSIKRKLSFGALDELLMLQQQPPSKRLHYSFSYDVGDQSSSTVQSFSCDQGLGFSQFDLDAKEGWIGPDLY